jgi:hypothetical protein
MPGVQDDRWHAAGQRLAVQQRSALPVPYSPYAVRGSSSVTGTRSAGPCTQMVPQCSSSGLDGRSAPISWRAEPGVKQIRSTTTSGRRSAIRAPNVPASSSASRSTVILVTVSQAGLG